MIILALNDSKTLSKLTFDPLGGRGKSDFTEGGDLRRICELIAWCDKLSHMLIRMCHVLFALSQAIKDLQLLGIVAILLVVDVVFLSCWIAIDPLQAEELTFEEAVSHTQEAQFGEYSISKSYKAQLLLSTQC